MRADGDHVSRGGDRHPPLPHRWEDHCFDARDDGVVGEAATDELQKSMQALALEHMLPSMLPQLDVFEGAPSAHSREAAGVQPEEYKCAKSEQRSVVQDDSSEAEEDNGTDKNDAPGTPRKGADPQRLAAGWLTPRELPASPRSKLIRSGDAWMRVVAAGHTPKHRNALHMQQRPQSGAVRRRLSLSPLADAQDCASTDDSPVQHSEQASSGAPHRPQAVPRPIGALDAELAEIWLQSPAPVEERSSSKVFDFAPSTCALPVCIPSRDPSVPSSPDIHPLPSPCTPDRPHSARSSALNVRGTPRPTLEQTWAGLPPCRPTSAPPLTPTKLQQRSSQLQPQLRRTSFSHPPSLARSPLHLPAAWKPSSPQGSAQLAASELKSKLDKVRSTMHRHQILSQDAERSWSQPAGNASGLGNDMLQGSLQPRVAPESPASENSQAARSGRGSPLTSQLKEKLQASMTGETVSLTPKELQKLLLQARSDPELLPPPAEPPLAQMPRSLSTHDNASFDRDSALMPPPPPPSRAHYLRSLPHNPPLSTADHSHASPKRKMPSDSSSSLGETNARFMRDRQPTTEPSQAQLELYSDSDDEDDEAFGHEALVPWPGRDDVAVRWRDTCMGEPLEDLLPRPRSYSGRSSRYGSTWSNTSSNYASKNATPLVRSRCTSEAGEDGWLDDGAPIMGIRRPLTDVAVRAEQERLLFDFQVREAEVQGMLTSMQAGVWLTKLDERCQESKRFLQVSPDGTELTCLAEEKLKKKPSGSGSGSYSNLKSMLGWGSSVPSRQLAQLFTVHHGPASKTFHAYYKQTRHNKALQHEPWLCVSVVFFDAVDEPSTLNLVFAKEDEVLTWVLGLQALSALKSSRSHAELTEAVKGRTKRMKVAFARHLDGNGDSPKRDRATDFTSLHTTAPARMTTPKKARLLDIQASWSLAGKNSRPGGTPPQPIRSLRPGGIPPQPSRSLAGKNRSRPATPPPWNHDPDNS